VEETLPFRWDLIAPDQLGTLLAGVAPPDLWFLDDLVECTGRVVARSGGADLIFVGRSLDSMFDLLGAALADVDDQRQVRRLPLSFQRSPVGSGRRWRRRPLTAGERAQARRALAAVGVTPHALARRDRPVAFVDVVHGGSTFTELYELLRNWIDPHHGSWPVVRRKLRFIGVTSMRKSSPNAFRWHQYAQWTRHLPATAVVNVSLYPDVWSYLGDFQVKLTRSYRPDGWLAGADGPKRDERTRRALAEAVAIVAYGRSSQGRRALARVMNGEPAVAEPWLRTLVTRLNRDR
jgi:hypothetical protein